MPYRPTRGLHLCLSETARQMRQGGRYRNIRCKTTVLKITVVGDHGKDFGDGGRIGALRCGALLG